MGGHLQVDIQEGIGGPLKEHARTLVQGSYIYSFPNVLRNPKRPYILPFLELNTLQALNPKP